MARLYPMGLEQRKIPNADQRLRDAVKARIATNQRTQPPREASPDVFLPTCINCQETVEWQLDQCGMIRLVPGTLKRHVCVNQRHFTSHTKITPEHGRPQPEDKRHQKKRLAAWRELDAD